MSSLSLSEPVLKGKELEYLKKCIDTGFISDGKYKIKFESKIKKITKSKYVLGCINGTSALHTALKLINITDNDEIIVPVLTFIAPINAVLYCGASPIFMDCDNFLNLNSDKLKEFLNTQTLFKNGYTWNKKTNKRIKALIVVHTFGNLANLNEIVPLLKSRNICLIEDAAEALGSYIKSKKKKKRHAGTIGRIGCFSFNSNKIITSAGGGALTFKIKKDYIKAKKIIDQFKTNNIWYEHKDIGYNYRLNNINAAIGCAQLDSLKYFKKRRRLNYELYKKYFLKISKKFKILENPDYSESNNWLVIVKVDFISKKKFIQFIDGLLEKKINVRPIWKLNHLHPHTKNYQNYKIINALEFQFKAVCLPSSSNLTEKNISYITGLFKCLI